MTNLPKPRYPARTQRYLADVGLTHPIAQAPMAGANDQHMAQAVSSAGGLGAIPAGMLTRAQLQDQVRELRDATQAPFAVNFFCHQPPVSDPAVNAEWLKKLEPYYQQLQLGDKRPELLATRHPFDEAMCELMVQLKPKVVSFHFGLPRSDLVGQLKSAGCYLQSSATTVAEAQWLETHGADAIIAQGLEAGGHRAHFLEPGLEDAMGTFALVPQIADAVTLPVIAAGGIADARGVAAALMLGASAVQLGSRYLYCPEAIISPAFRDALTQAKGHHSRITNVFSGRPARGLLNRAMQALGPISAEAPSFPLASSALGPLRAAAEAQGKVDFTPLWAGQAVNLVTPEDARLNAGQLTNELGRRTLELLAGNT